MNRRPLRFGFSTLGCPAAGFDEVVALADAHRLQVVELRALCGSIDLPAQLRARFGTPGRIVAWRAAHPSAPTFPVVDASFRLSDGTDEDFEALCSLAPWAEALGAEWLRVFDGPGADGPAGLREAARRLARWSELRDRHGWRVALAVETHDSLLNSAAIDRFTAVAPTTAIVWDAHHTWKRGQEDPDTTWARCAERIVHVHLKDSRSSVAGQGPFAGYVLPGDGDFPGHALWETLKRADFAGAAVLEWERLWHPTLPPLEAALERARAAWICSG